MKMIVLLEMAALEYFSHFTKENWLDIEELTLRLELASNAPLTPYAIMIRRQKGSGSAPARITHGHQITFRDLEPNKILFVQVSIHALDPKSQIFHLAYGKNLRSQSRKIITVLASDNPCTIYLVPIGRMVPQVIHLLTFEATTSAGTKKTHTYQFETAGSSQESAPAYLRAAQVTVCDLAFNLITGGLGPIPQ